MFFFNLTKSQKKDSRANKRFFDFALIYIGIDTVFALEPLKMKIMTQKLKGMLI